MSKSTPTLIVADDNADFAQLLARKATKEGWTVVLCRDGKELLTAVEHETGSALVLVDINMPNLDGIEAIRELTWHENAKRMRFCVMTGGEASNAIAARLIAQAGDLTISQSFFKPFSMEKFGAFLSEQKKLLSKTT
ncbi:response regulator [Primorskyibacter sp. 2E233]|uniref:response regulator n=1 Tax=Primorskyibacter sp. 2E233 TaxID=3413431 RepID=UPI003BF43BA5